MPRGRMKPTPALDLDNYVEVRGPQRNPIGRAVREGRRQESERKLKAAAAVLSEHGMHSGKDGLAKPRPAKAHRNPRGRR